MIFQEPIDDHPDFEMEHDSMIRKALNLPSRRVRQEQVVAPSPSLRCSM